MKTPLISIIIPVYNREAYISETLESVLNQTYTAWECLVVDDGSTDKTVKIVEGYASRYANVTLYHRPIARPKGGNAARNYGFENSKGDYVIFLDSDDQLMAEALANRQACLQRDAYDCCIHPTLVFKSQPGDSELLWNSLPERMSNDQALVRFLNTDMPWQTNGVTWSRSFFKSFGIWDERLKAWQDWELHCRALLAAPNIYISETPDNYYRYMTQSGIASKHQNSEYTEAVEQAIKGIVHQLQQQRISEPVQKAMRKLLLRRFIAFNLRQGHLWRPVSLFFETDLKPFISAIDYFKFYLLFLLGKSTKLRTYLLKNRYRVLQSDMHAPSTHLKTKQ
ncbi:MAG: glycosyltransferase family 2 protein [Algicola sp.]|nr:glycosyltransferase family 2 protein [Algicola sp.]